MRGSGAVGLQMVGLVEPPYSLLIVHSTKKYYYYYYHHYHHYNLHRSHNNSPRYPHTEDCSSCGMSGRRIRIRILPLGAPHHYCPQW